jgi:FMN-dependent NADH-azoreductase
MHTLLALLATFTIGGCTDGAAELTPDDLRAINELRDSVTNAIVAGDAAAYANLCTEDVRLLHGGSPIITGSAELEAHNAAMFEAVSVTSLVLTPMEIYGTGDLAYEVGTQELTIEPTVPEFAGSRKYVHVFRRGIDGEWRFAALMSNNN